MQGEELVSYIKVTAAERAIKANADVHAQNVRPIIDAIRKAGARTVRETAAALNARGIAKARGGRKAAASA